jgi:hypothetical protein
MKIVILFAQLVAFGYGFYWFFKKQPTALRKFFWPCLVAKIVAGFTLGLIYLYYYKAGDTLQYFEDGKIISEWARTDLAAYLQFLWNHEAYPEILSQFNSFDQRALFFTKLTSFMNLITLDNYWLVSMYFSGISFLGFWSLFKRIQEYFPDLLTIALVSFLAFPSILFWTSGLLKESLASAALFYLSALFLDGRFKKRFTLWWSLLALLSVWLLWTLKYYYAVVFVPAVFTCLAHRFIFYPLLKPKSLWSETLIWCTIFLVAVSVASFVHPNLNFGNFLEVIVENNRAYIGMSSPQDLIHYYNLTPEIDSILINLPWALVSGLFRPFFWEAGNVFQLIAGFENLVLIVIFLMSLPALPAAMKSDNRILIWAIIVYVTILCAFLALSTPNFGTLSRYRIGFLPYFLVIALAGNPVVTRIERSLHRLVR